MPESHPLDWPEHWPITPQYDRIRSRFKKHSYIRGRKDLILELERLKADYIVISSNVVTNLNGSPRSQHGEPQDGAVAAWFQWKGLPFVIACDTYIYTWENARAIVKTVEAFRTIERHGASQLLERAVSGFTALPPGADEKPVQPWWEVLGLDVGEDSLINPQVLKAVIADAEHPMRKAVLKMAEALFKVKVSECHPDVPGGSEEKMQEANSAIASARLQLGEKEDGE